MRYIMIMMMNDKEMSLSEQHTMAQMRACKHDWDRSRCHGMWTCAKCGALGSTIYYQDENRPTSIRMDKDQDCSDAPHNLARVK